ncbi:MAG: hydroxyacylglutathione hydrolase [Thiobacillus sp.]|nr:hydroxyacylglutathione hydrolase [Thiobacillus sp.]
MLQLEPILAFEDNYIWVAHDDRCALLVDPGEAAPILAWLSDRRIRPVAILVTHRHGDHIGGIAEILHAYPDCPVFGPRHERLPQVTHPVADGDICVVAPLGLRFEVLAVPGHTLDHLAYFGHGWLFCGDTLFSCGCGKVFEGSPAMLHASLERLAGLPADTLVCCAHEYTLDNIRFALTVDPDNAALTAWQRRAIELRQAARPTLPTRLADELACNPFLRCHDPALVARLAGMSTAGFGDSTGAFTALRALKDGFR